MSYITATGLYPSDYYQNDQEPLSINLNLGNVFENQSNELVQYIKTSSNILNTKINITSNNIINHINNIETFNIKNELISGSDYIWNEQILEPLNHLSSIHQVYDNNITPELDASLFRYFFLTKTELREAKTKTQIPSYSTNISYY